MNFSIITPSLQRPSLKECCESLDRQTFEDWQHIIMLDLSDSALDWDFLSTLLSPRRIICTMGKRFGHYGNKARHSAWPHATGDYLLYLDDDNTMYRDNALTDIASCLTDGGLPDWAIFPIHRHGSHFFHVPPGLCMTDTANLVVRREVGRWPDIESREADGFLIEHLKNEYPFATGFPNCPPIVRMDRSSNGE